MPGKKQFHYMGNEGMKLFRVKQITTLHHVSKNIKYDSDVLSIVQDYLIKIKEPSLSHNLHRTIQLRESIKSE